MASLTRSTTLEGTVSQTVPSKTYTFATANKVVDKNIQFTVNVNSMTLTAPSSGENTFAITVPNGTSNTVTFTFHVDSSSNVYID